MHSSCLISGIQPADRSPRGLSELDKHPAFKLRKATMAHDKRLAIRLACLDQQCHEMTSKMAHNMKMTNLALKQIQNKHDSRTNWGSTSPGNGTTDNSRDFKRRYGYSIIDEPSRRPKKHSMSRNGTLPPLKSHEERRGENSGIKPLQKRPDHRPCTFGVTKDGTCSHFPCQQPETYHSLGFRLDDSSTQQWITWAELKKAKIDLPHYNTASNLRAANNDDQSSGLRRWCSLPMDFESRKIRLKEEIEKRRIQNVAKKPKSWETNYGKLTPYKVLAYPVRLHPLQMSTK